MTLRRLILLLGACLALAPAPTLARNVDGIRFDDRATVAGQELRLNGAGIRFKAVFKVYAAGLYLTNRCASLPEVLAVGGARRVRIVLLRDIGSEEFRQSFLGAIQRNNERSEKNRLAPQLVRLSEQLGAGADLKSGDVLIADWVPGIGTSFLRNGQQFGEPLPDLAFFNAVLRIWLGDKPVDAGLKRLMLGEIPDDVLEERQ
ncbi:Hypothetical protein IMCC9480_1715 [Oxalobacteraceae bacterium IMCC9480]|nr:Hypothetical protein IMCC9480_1715 [Oxalobacteraceae bacterium IMCC9480]NDP58647.1 lipoprotein transmembrane [Oxalobacteraceae bacterium]